MRHSNELKSYLSTMGCFAKANITGGTTDALVTLCFCTRFKNVGKANVDLKIN